MSAAAKSKKEITYKVLILGEVESGKTSIVRRYTYNLYTPKYRATIGVDFTLKKIEWDKKTAIRLQLYDTAGQERFQSMTRVYYKDAVGCLMVFDITKPGSLDGVLRWKNDLDSKITLVDGTKLSCILLANKCDLVGKQFVDGMAESINKFCRENEFIGWFETSAQENINIDKAVQFLIKDIMDKEKKMMERDASQADKIFLNDKSPKKGCC